MRGTVPIACNVGYTTPPDKALSHSDNNYDEEHVGMRRRLRGDPWAGRR
jgi:hypothetical protein